MKTAIASATKHENGQANLKQSFVQNSDGVVFDSKLEEAKDWLKRSGLTDADFEKLLKNPPVSKQPIREWTQEDMENDTYNFIWSLTLQNEEKSRLIATLQQEIEEQNRRIATLELQLKKQAASNGSRSEKTVKTKAA